MNTRKRVFIDVDLHRAGVRTKLEPRNEPYWKPLVPRGYIGLRKASHTPTSWTWIARWRKDDGTSQPRSLTRHDSVETYEEAKAAAEQWFAQCREGVTKTGTVREAIEQYIADQSKEKGGKAAAYAKRVLEPYVLSLPIADKRLDQLRHKDVKEWRDQLLTLRTPAQSKGQRAKKDIARRGNSANRILRIFKAALNHAKAEKLVASDAAWCDIKPLKDSDGQREIYLTLEQRRTLLAECTPNLANMLTAMLYTAARPTEVWGLDAEDFDGSTGTLNFTTFKGNGKGNRRTLHLTPDAKAFFKLMARSKTPKAPLITRNGERWNKGWASRDLRAAMVRANAALVQAEMGTLPDNVVAYTMRHTAISEWLKEGVDIGRVAKATGTSIVMIQKHYQKFIPQDFVERLSHVQVI